MMPAGKSHTALFSGRRLVGASVVIMAVALVICVGLYGDDETPVEMLDSDKTPGSDTYCRYVACICCIRKSQFVSSLLFS
jgi:hypothetical protein